MPDDAAISFSINPSISEPRKYAVKFDQYLDALAFYIRKNRGLNLRGTVPPTTYNAIFLQHSKPWKSIIEQCTNRCQSSTRSFLKEASCKVAGEYGGSKLMDHLIMPAFYTRARNLNEKVEELLWPYLHSHPVISDTRFNAASETCVLFPVKNDLWVNRLSSDADPDRIAAAKAVDITQVYYDVSHKSSYLA